eukprot:11214233-Lingulodinium_polyedra.AAC.1
MRPSPTGCVPGVAAGGGGPAQGVPADRKLFAFSKGSRYGCFVVQIARVGPRISKSVPMPRVFVGGSPPSQLPPSRCRTG